MFNITAAVKNMVFFVKFGVLREGVYFVIGAGKEFL